MSNFQPIHRLNRENVFIYLNDTPISGAQSLSASWNSNLSNIKFLGMQQQEIVEKPIGPQVGTVTLNSLVVNQDQFINFTGEAGLNGYVLDPESTNKNYSFTSGFLTSYNSRASINSIPEINTTFTVLGNMGNLPTGGPLELNFQQNRSNLNNSGEYSIADPNRISISLDDYDTNRVLNYELIINVDRNSFYSIGGRSASAVKINYPIEVTTTFQFEIDNYDFRNMKDSPCKEKIENLSIGLNKYQGGQILSYDFSGMKLIAETYSATTEGNIVVDATYRTYLKKLDSVLNAKPALPNFDFDSNQNSTTGVAAIIYGTGVCDIELGDDPEFCFECINDTVCGRGVCTPTPSNTPSTSISPSASNTPSNTPTNTPTPSVTPSISVTPTPSNTPTNTPTPTPSEGAPPPTPPASPPASPPNSPPNSPPASPPNSPPASQPAVDPECFDAFGGERIPTVINVHLAFTLRSDCHGNGTRDTSCDDLDTLLDNDIECGVSNVTVTLEAYSEQEGLQVTCGSAKTINYVLDGNDENSTLLNEGVDVPIIGCCCAQGIKYSYTTRCTNDCAPDCDSNENFLDVSNATQECNSFDGCCPENGVIISITG